MRAFRFMAKDKKKKNILSLVFLALAAGGPLASSLIWGVSPTRFPTYIAGFFCCYVIMATGVFLANYTAFNRTARAKRELEDAQNHQRMVAASKHLARQILMVESPERRWEIIATIPGELFHLTREEIISLRADAFIPPT